jgi:hypothetical protein
MLVDSAADDGSGNPVPVYSPVALTAGASYSVEVSGDFSLWAADTWTNLGACPGGTEESAPNLPSPSIVNGDTGLDAEYLYGAPNGSATYCANGSFTVSIPYARRALRFDLGSGNFAPPPHPQETTFQPGHIYHYLVTGTGAPLGVEVSKVCSYGQFRVLVTPSP